MKYQGIFLLSLTPSPPKKVGKFIFFLEFWEHERSVQFKNPPTNLMYQVIIHFICAYYVSINKRRGYEQQLLGKTSDKNNNFRQRCSQQGDSPRIGMYFVIFPWYTFIGKGKGKSCHAPPSPKIYSLLFLFFYQGNLALFSYPLPPQKGTFPFI